MIKDLQTEYKEFLRTFPNDASVSKRLSNWIFKRQQRKVITNLSKKYDVPVQEINLYYNIQESSKKTPSPIIRVCAFILVWMAAIILGTVSKLSLEISGLHLIMWASLLPALVFEILPFTSNWYYKGVGDKIFNWTEWFSFVLGVWFIILTILKAQ